MHADRENNETCPMKTYECAICGWIYDEAKGCPEEGIPAGTRWEDVPEDWHCPVCGAGKADFNMVVIKSKPLSAGSPTLASPQATSESLTILGTGLAGYTLAREFRKIDSLTPLRLITRDGGGYLHQAIALQCLGQPQNPGPVADEDRRADGRRTECRHPGA
jgi:rubredoxin-NAD+ reductase